MSLDQMPSPEWIRQRKAELEARPRGRRTPATALPVAPASSSEVARTTGRRQRAEHEHAEQAAFVAWADSAPARAEFPELEALYAVPNGGGRSEREGGSLKAEGVRAGQPDTCLPLPRRTPDGHVVGALYLEFKDLSGQLSARQRARIALLERCGNLVEVVTTARAAQVFAIHYLSLPRP